MNNFKYLYDHLSSKKIMIRNPNIYIDISRYLDGNVFHGNTLYEFASYVKSLLKFKLLPKNIHFNFGDIEFADNITALLFDRLFYDLCKTNFIIYINLDVNFTTPNNYCFLDTVLYKTTKDSTHGAIDKKKFTKEYERNIHVDKHHYRRLLRAEELKNNLMPSIIGSEISTLLKPNFDDSKWRSEVCEVITELMTNVRTHTSSDCLIDLNICQNLAKKTQDDGVYKALEVAVINFSEHNIYDKIKSNIHNHYYSREDPIYQVVYKAFQNHQTFFNANYSEDHFFMLASFQWKVSSRSSKSNMGGTGLPRLISNIHDKTSNNYSYLLSGNKILFLENEFMKFNSNNLLGFNLENDFENHPIDSSLIDETKLYIPGTIFSLYLLMEDHND